MRELWIVLITFIFALLAQGKSTQSGFPKEANISPALPSVSIKHRLEGIADDLSGGESGARREGPSERPPETPGQTQSVEPKGLTFREIKKFVRSQDLDSKHTSRKLLPQTKSRPHFSTNLDDDADKTESHYPQSEATGGHLSRKIGRFQSDIDKHKSDQAGGLTLSEVLKVLQRHYLDQKHQTRNVAQHKKSKSHPSNHKDLPRKEASGTQTSSDEEQPDRSYRLALDKLRKLLKSNNLNKRQFNFLKMLKHSLKSGSHFGFNEINQHRTKNSHSPVEPTTGRIPETPTTGVFTHVTGPEDMNRDTKWGSGESQKEASYHEVSGSDMVSSGSGEPNVMPAHSNDGDYVKKGRVSERSISKQTAPESTTFESASEQEGPQDPTILSAIPLEEPPSPYPMEPSPVPIEQMGISESSGTEEDEGLSTESADVTMETVDPRFASSTNLADPEHIEHGGQSDYANKQKRGAPEFEHDFTNEESKRNAKMDSSKEPFSVPASDVRWTGISVAHDKSRDGAASDKQSKQKKKKHKFDSVSMVVAVLNVIFIVGGLLLVILMGAFLAFAWPLRKYYMGKCQRMENDLESGQREDVELTSIRVDRDHVQEHFPLLAPVTQQKPSKASNSDPTGVVGPSPGVSMPVVGKKVAGNLIKASSSLTSKKQPFSRDATLAVGAEKTPDQSEKRSGMDVVADDKKRDTRNAQRRKIIKEETSRRRDSLVDSIKIAKSIIDDHGKNKQYEKKASQRRRIVKECTSGAGLLEEKGKRRMSFAEELQAGCSVITPDSTYKDGLEQLKEKRRTIKDKTAGKRRASLADEIEVAKSVIMDNPKRYINSLSPSLLEQMISVGLQPEDYLNYHVMDYSKPGAKKEYGPGGVRPDVKKVADDLVKASLGLGIDKQPSSKGKKLTAIAENNPPRTIMDVIADDKKRDSRNAERRKVIKVESAKRRESLVDGIRTAKRVLDDCAKSKKYEKKASKRRRIIKECTSGAGLSEAENKRRMPFAEELQTGRSVITPHSAYKDCIEELKVKRRTIKDQTAGKRRASLADEIKVAKSVIMENPSRYRNLLHPSLVEQMISVGQQPEDYDNYCVMDYSKPGAKKGYGSGSASFDPNSY